jgi:sortase A
MKKSNLIQKMCALVGGLMLVSALSALLYWQWNINHSQKQASIYVETLHNLMPQPQNAVPEERRDNTMSVLSVDGVDFVGIVELPRYGSVLPVCGNWGRTAQYPCRFGGSIYDGSLQIGATTQKGQYSFYREISVGDTVIFTDVEGNRYIFQVAAMRYEKHIDQVALQRQEAALTLFVKNIYSFEYLIIFCENAA